MVAKQIEREVGSLLLTDKVLQKAVCPEKDRGADSYLSAIASVTEVDLSRDLQVAKVYISVYSDEEGKEKAFAGLKKLEGYVRKAIGQRIRLRLTPEIRLIPDDSFEQSQRVLSLLEKIKDGSYEPPAPAVPGDEDPWVPEDAAGFGSLSDAEERRRRSDAEVERFLSGGEADARGAGALGQARPPSRNGKKGQRRR